MSLKPLKTLTIGAVATLLASAAFANPYEKFEGTTVVVSWPALAHFQAAEELIEEFVEETGIDVEVDALQYLKLRDRQILEMSKPEGEYDVVSWVVMWKGEYVSKGLLTPLSEFFTSGSLVDPLYDIDDIADAYLQNGGVVGGTKGYMPGKSGALYGIPFGAETSILAYRKDIFEEQGIEVPTTYDELAAVMTKLDEAGIPALTSRGKTGHQVTAAWLLHLAPMGGKIFDEEWNPVVNSPEAVKAAEFLRHVARTGPTGIETFGFGEAAAAFLQGDAAMHLDTLKIAAMSRNPEPLENRRQGRLCAASGRHPLRIGDRWFCNGYSRQRSQQGSRLSVHPIYDVEGWRSAHGGTWWRPYTDLDAAEQRRQVSGLYGHG